MLAQPGLEVGDQLGLAGRRYHGRGSADAELDKVPSKEPGAVDGVVVPPAASAARTPAAAQVLAERRQIDVSQAHAALDHDVAGMGCRPQIAHGRVWTVALPFE